MKVYVPFLSIAYEGCTLEYDPVHRGYRTKRAAQRAAERMKNDQRYSFDCDAEVLTVEVPDAA